MAKQPLIQYILDEVSTNTSNGRGCWAVHEKVRSALRKAAQVPRAFDWDTESQIRIHLHRFSDRNQPLDRDGLVTSFKPIQDGIIDSLALHFGREFDDRDENRFHLVYSQSKASNPILAKTTLVTIDLVPSFLPYSGVIMRWGYTPEIMDAEVLIQGLTELRIAKVDKIHSDLAKSRKGTKKVANLEKSLKKTQKAIALTH